MILTRKYILTFLYFSLTHSLTYASPCVVTIAKSVCWGDYQVHVELLDRINNQLLADTVLEKNQYWTRVTFDCKPLQVIKARAAFTPAIFKNDEGRFFMAKRFWAFPQSAPTPGSEWTFNICFDQEFSNLPMPLKANGNCACDFSKIPPVTLPAKE